VTRPTRRELERELADLVDETPGERPPALTAEEKAALDERYDVTVADGLVVES